MNQRSLSEGKQLRTEGRFLKGSNYEPKVAFRREAIMNQRSLSEGKQLRTEGRFPKGSNYELNANNLTL